MMLRGFCFYTNFFLFINTDDNGVEGTLFFMQIKTALMCATDDTKIKDVLIATKKV